MSGAATFPAPLLFHLRQRPAAPPHLRRCRPRRRPRRAAVSPAKARSPVPRPRPRLPCATSWSTWPKKPLASWASLCSRRPAFLKHGPPRRLRRPCSLRQLQSDAAARRGPGSPTSTPPHAATTAPQAATRWGRRPGGPSRGCRRCPRTPRRPMPRGRPRRSSPEATAARCALPSSRSATCRSAGSLPHPRRPSRVAATSLSCGRHATRLFRCRGAPVSCRRCPSFGKLCERTKRCSSRRPAPSTGALRPNP
mmetsp:Transcript_66873/g.193208  ORF Transcript_66873/g.193208 Transcript_66873/m.193208 type:complete len:252 (-) Transcript_66873:2807-3562(-)